MVRLQSLTTLAAKSETAVKSVNPLHRFGGGVYAVKNNQTYIIMVSDHNYFRTLSYYLLGHSPFIMDVRLGA